MSVNPYSRLVRYVIESRARGRGRSLLALPVITALPAAAARDRARPLQSTVTFRAVDNQQLVVCGSPRRESWRKPHEPGTRLPAEPGLPDSPALRVMRKFTARCTVGRRRLSASAGAAPRTH